VVFFWGVVFEGTRRGGRGSVPKGLGSHESQRNRRMENGERQEEREKEREKRSSPLFFSEEERKNTESEREREREREKTHHGGGGPSFLLIVGSFRLGERKKQTGQGLQVRTPDVDFRRFPKKNLSQKK
jgi:hypothetical protein